MSLPEINAIYVLLIKWAYSSWQRHKCFVTVLSRYHTFHRTAISKPRYVSVFKILYHLLFKVSRATNKEQNVWNIWTKVSDETCCSWLRSSEAGKITEDPQSIRSGVFFTPLEKKRISRIKKSKNVNQGGWICCELKMGKVESWIIRRKSPSPRKSFQ